MGIVLFLLSFMAGSSPGLSFEQAFFLGRSPEVSVVRGLAFLMVLVLMVNFLGMALWRAAPSLLDRQPKPKGNLVDAVVGDEEDEEGPEADAENPASEEATSDAA